MTKTTELPHFQCPECGTGTMFVYTRPIYHTYIGGRPVRVPNAQVAVCDRCNGRSVAAPEVERWERLEKEQRLPNADTAAKSEREPCPECGKPSEIASIPFGTDAAITLSCGCETRNQEWLQVSHAQDKAHYRRQNRIHNEHASKCPCAPCQAAQRWETTK